MLYADTEANGFPQWEPTSAERLREQECKRNETPSPRIHRRHFRSTRRVKWTTVPSHVYIYISLPVLRPVFFGRRWRPLACFSFFSLAAFSQRKSWLFYTLWSSKIARRFSTDFPEAKFVRKFFMLFCSLRARTDEISGIFFSLIIKNRVWGFRCFEKISAFFYPTPSGKFTKFIQHCQKFAFCCCPRRNLEYIFSTNCHVRSWSRVFFSLVFLCVTVIRH